MTKKYYRMSSTAICMLILICSTGQLKGQVKSFDCRCPRNNPITGIFTEEPDTIFHFSNGMAIGLCGERGIDSTTHKISFYEFILYVCGQDSSIASGGGYLENSNLEMNGDTLILEDWPYLPTGENFLETPTLWTIEKIYFTAGAVHIENSINTNIRLYGSNEIHDVLGEFERYDCKHITLNDSTFELTYKLFIATLSGSTRARKYFNGIKKCSGLDAAYAEMYTDLCEKLIQWDEK